MLEPKPLDEFGGWLKFFFVTQWIGLVLCAVSIPVFALGVLYQFVSPAPKDGLMAFVALLDSAVTLWVARRVVRRAKDRDPAVPAEMYRWMLVLMGIGAAVLVADAVVAFALGGTPLSADDWTTLKMDSKSIQWGLVWALYFKHSKRVRAFYGETPA